MRGSTRPQNDKSTQASPIENVVYVIHFYEKLAKKETIKQGIWSPTKK
jgi:hypothetical protein